MSVILPWPYGLPMRGMFGWTCPGVGSDSVGRLGRSGPWGGSSEGVEGASVLPARGRHV